MLIYFVCKNKHKLQVAEETLREKPLSYRYCFCGEKLSIANTSVDEIVCNDLQEQVRDNIDKWARTEGCEGCVELIERTRKTVGEKIYNLYRAELQRRGLKC